MSNLKNKVAVVTGSANGLGRAIATELKKQGCHLALIDIDHKGLEQIKIELQNGNQIISIHPSDISDESQIISTRNQILQQHQHVDILINNAGVSMSQAFDQLKIDDFKWLFDINFWGTVYCTKHFLPDLKEQRNSWIVNIISDFALMGFPGKTTYSSSKGAVMGFTNSLKTELVDTSVKVSLVIPPPMDTNLVRNSKHINEDKRKKEADFLKRNGMPLDKVAQKIISKFKAGKYRIVIGTMMFWIDFASRLFPSLLHWLIGKNKKQFDFV